MKESEAIESLAALAQPSRLAVFRLLVQRGPEGYVVGDLGGRLGIPGPTLSFHLKALTRAGLISARKEGRFLYYSADFAQMNALVAFLTEHCCSLSTQCAPDTCAPIRQPSIRKRSA